MIDGPFLLALSSGMVATVNPCGFAMLPAYLSYFLGMSSGPDGRPSTLPALRRALVVSGALLVGFFAVFVGFGVAIRGFGVDQGDILRYATWPGTVIGIVLIVVGAAMLAGWHLPFATPRMSKGGHDTTLGSMVAFGVSYAVTSLSCGAAPFVGTVMGSFTREGFVSGVWVFAMYAAGMGLVVTALTVSMSVAHHGVLRALRSTMSMVERAAGTLLVASGAYLVYFWALDGREKNNPVSNIQARAETWFVERSTWTLVVVFGAIVTAAGAAVLLARRNNPITGRDVR